MLIGKIIEDDSEVKNFSESLLGLSDKDFKKKVTFEDEEERDEMTLKLFHFHSHSSNEEIEAFFQSINFPTERIKLFLEQLWQKIEPSLRNIDNLERENLVDIQWKLITRTRGTEGGEKLFVQLELLVEKNAQLRKHHLQLDVPKFYHFFQELTKANASLQEILQG